MSWASVSPAAIPSICEMDAKQIFANVTVQPSWGFEKQVESHVAILNALYKESKEQSATKERALKEGKQADFENASKCLNTLEWYTQPYLTSSAVAQKKIDEGFLFQPTSIEDGPPATGEICNGANCADVDPLLVVFFLIADKVVNCLNNNTCPKPPSSKIRATLSSKLLERRTW